MSERRNFFRWVAIGTGCWLWKRCSFSASGYGAVRVRGKVMTSHRRSWELVHGPIPAGMHVCHRCDVRLCCRPSHLFLGTNDENMADMGRKGRARSTTLTRQQVASALTRIDLGERQGDIAHELGVTSEAIGYWKRRRHVLVQDGLLENTAT